MPPPRLGHLARTVISAIPHLEGWPDHRDARILRSGLTPGPDTADDDRQRRKGCTTTPRRIRVMRTRNSSPPGDDGRASITTQPGEVQLLPVNPPAQRAPKSALLLHLYVLLFAALAIGTVVVLVTSGFDFAPIWVVVSLGLLAAAAERARVRITSNLEFSISLLPILFVAVVYGPLTGRVGGRHGDAWRLPQPISALGPLHVRWGRQWSSGRDSRWTCGCDGK